MPEPTTTTAAGLTLAGAAVAVPTLTIMGLSLGLRADILMAGFSGSIAAMALLNSVPGAGDDWKDMLKTTGRRMGVAVTSSLTAGYLTPLAALAVERMADTLLLGVAFVVGAGAQKVLAKWIATLAKQKDGA